MSASAKHRPAAKHAQRVGLRKTRIPVETAAAESQTAFIAAMKNLIAGRFEFTACVGAASAQQHCSLESAQDRIRQGRTKAKVFGPLRFG